MREREKGGNEKENGKKVHFSCLFFALFQRIEREREWQGTGIASRMPTCPLATFAHNYGLQNCCSGSAAPSTRT